MTCIRCNENPTLEILEAKVCATCFMRGFSEIVRKQPGEEMEEIADKLAIPLDILSNDEIAPAVKSLCDILMKQKS